MKIKRLDIFGFKSFVDKVSIEFETGITGIVGPNGCGKSNILDAIRWVMGEQNVRHLRGRMMEDVIFGGSETRKPTGLAEVSVIFDNSDGNCPAAYKDFAEIMVTRKLYRSGDSDYLINKTPCRLLDINELFMDTGVGARAYSIIEQGKVGALVSAKPEERRSLIEEVAGVTKYKSRKKSALRKMDATRQNLIRLGDIISEVRRQIGSLQRQAGKAEKFRELRREARQIELSLSGNRLRRLDQEVALLEQQEKSEADALERLDGQLETGELRLEEQQLQLAAAEGDYHQAQQQEYQAGADITRLEGELGLLERQQEQLQEQEQQARTELEQCALRLAELESEACQLQTQQQESKDSLSDLEDKTRSAEKELDHVIERDRQANERYEQSRRALMEQFAQASRLQNRREEIERRLTAEQQRQQQLHQELSRIDERQGELDEQVQQLAGQRIAVSSNIESLQEQQQGLQEELQVIKNNLEQQQAVVHGCRQDLAQLRSRYESLEELQQRREGCGEGTRALLTATAGRRIVADLLRVDAEHELAVESVLGERLQAVPLSRGESPLISLELLQQQQVRGLILLTHQGGAADGGSPGVPLLDLVSPVEGAEQVIAQLLGGVFLVDAVADHLEQPLAVGETLVDRTGTCLDWRGILCGGSMAASATGLLRRQRQLEELVEGIAELESKHRSQERELEVYQDRLSETEEVLAQRQGEIHRLELQSLELGKDQQALDKEQDGQARRRQLLSFDLEQIDEAHSGLLAEMEECLAGRETALAQQQELEHQQQHNQQELSLLRQEVDRCRETLTGYRVAFASLQQQRQAADQTLGRVERQCRELRERRQNLEQRLSQQEASRSQLQQRQSLIRVELDQRLDDRQAQLQQTVCLQEAYQQLREELEEQREQLRRLRSDAEDARRTVARLQLRQREQHLEAEHLYQGVQERYAVDLRLHQVPQATTEELERQQQQLQRLQQKIAELGEVNLMAIEEYEEQQKRYDFFIGQRDDLKQSLDDLEKAIAQINRTTRRRFKETFDQANELFRQVFPRLFRGGQAELRLNDENDLLETGIDIIVQPPGKRLQNVNLLSGGEKALTAVALIFSLFLLKPTPFCVLDEVDAPLDDANIDRFAEMVREMTDRSQFILITHSKRTMSVVDTLYGVTMQEPGVSRLVSVRMNDYVPTVPDEAGRAVAGV
ncbi:chromosome segregation protein SMC [Pelovirga terrestris]|uniref:Chromosome partition protein Smc n=1 Tax=Pelovirga terrestris TaxID=2771352 RepID=A0A8J6QML7_9BACT|nr:chromosome segregation protein SMC [Pelovirga terrestris]MBD1401449.1 chromosome segregation protein SMC [Pelovirga terrestris]